MLVQFSDLLGRQDFTSEDLVNIVFDIEDNIVAVNGPTSRNDVTNGAPVNQQSREDEEISMLMEENLSLKRQTMCAICRNKIVSVVLLPCGHICCCEDCSPATEHCPRCKTFVKATVCAYLTWKFNARLKAHWSKRQTTIDLSYLKELNILLIFYCNNCSLFTRGL